MVKYLTSTDAKKFLSRVPASKSFRIEGGKDIYDLKGLADALDEISDSSYRHHVSGTRNDFANWVEDVMGDDDLARALRSASNRRSMLHAVQRRIGFLETIMTEPRISTSFMRYTAIDFSIGLAIGIVAGYLLARFVLP